VKYSELTTAINRTQEGKRNIFIITTAVYVTFCVVCSTHSSVSITKQEVLETTNSPTFPTEDFI
jgi:hypothetical protein